MEGELLKSLLFLFPGFIVGDQLLKDIRMDRKTGKAFEIHLKFAQCAKSASLICQTICF